VGRDLAWSAGNETTALGHLLAPDSVRYIVVPVGIGDAGATAPMVAALDRQVDLVPVGLDPSYEVFANIAWLPVFSVLSSNASAAQLVAAASGGGGWASASQLEQLDLSSAGALGVGPSGAGRFTVLIGPSADVLYGTVPPGSWRVTADSHGLPVQPVGGGATSWVLPVGRSTVAVARTGSGGQHLADVGMLLLWAFGLWAARWRIRARSGGQFSMVNLELGSPGADVVEIDWSSVLDGQNVG
jgi:hypothetical protein